MKTYTLDQIESILMTTLGRSGKSFDASVNLMSKMITELKDRDSILSRSVENIVPSASERRSKVEEFKRVTKPVMEWLANNHHPHHTVIITPTNAELLEGGMATGPITDHLKD